MRWVRSLFSGWPWRRDERGNRRGNMPPIETPYALGGANEPMPLYRGAAILGTPVVARVELAELASWYCELALLYFCGHRGEYFNRTTLNVEQVPWA
jgi:hypothetical protein